MNNLTIKIHTAIADISPDDWNALVKDNNPFLRYEFLHALEQYECVSAKFGWLPRHIVIYEREKLIAAMPVYEKHNSYGEFVFDNAWADAWQRSGLQYYPKLVIAAPYTPATGQRLLVNHDDVPKINAVLLDVLKELAHKSGASGVHILFPNPEEQSWLQQQNGFFARHDCQYHWFNQNYQTFDDFLATLTAKKRKNIRQERRRVERAGVTFRVLDGHTATDADWQQFDYFYQKTFDEKWGTATLNEAFFKAVAKALPEQIVLVMADQGNECIAGALMYRSNTTLYGRYWGCSEHVDALHFEACYYQGIDYCIQHGLQRFEPGAQGEHKIARGFVPTLTRSSHWLADNPFQASIDNFVNHEKEAVAQYIDDCMQHTPYREV